MDEVQHDQGAALFTVQQVADLLGCSTRHVRRLADRAAMPAPVRLGSLVRWRGDQIEQWIMAGCPSRWVERAS
ncbi:MAG: helix-turn-helix domain-containing protein [Phycisphaerales bacterium]|nr:helix-turn-helix domain-containing protein [Phycisphaerales bacterium]